MRVLPSLLVLVALFAIGTPSIPRDARTIHVSASDWVARIDRERALAEGLPEHQPHATAEGIALGTNGLVTPDGVRMATEAHGEIGIELARFGRGALRFVDAGTPSIVGPEVRITRAPGVTEWWRSLPSGLEQGITLASRPSGVGTLHFELEARGGAPSIEGGEVAIRDASGELVAGYAHLMVRDARGASVPARLAVREGRIRIDVDDADARYPIVVDPLLYTPFEAMLTGAGAVAQGRFGVSLATSTDGSRVVVGASFDRSARVFVRSGSTWTAEATLRDPAPPATAPNFGTSVAMSGDGATIVVGAPVNTGGGQALVFVRSGTTWTRQQTLSRPGGAVGDQFGAAVAIATDGSCIAVGAPSASGGGVDTSGAAHVFTRSGSTWSHLAEMNPPSRTAFGHFGTSMAIGGSNRIVVGAPDAGTGGAAYLFVSSGGYSTTYPSTTAGEHVGISVAASGDHCLIGYDGGARYYESVFNALAVVTLVPTPAGRYGASVALSSIGATRLALIGGPYANGGASRSGAGALFRRAGTTWSTPAEASLLTAVAPGVDDFLGSSVALSGDGTRAFAGAIFDDTPDTGFNGGSVHVFGVALGLAVGDACAADDACLSGVCADGVCCSTVCGDGVDDASDCVACTMALTGGTNGTCGALSAAAAPTILCRAAADTCDADDHCEGGDPVCHDGRRPTGDSCRPATGACDQPEVCDGVSATCPGDTLIAAGVVCRSDMGLCDIEEVCDGLSGACPTDVVEAAGLVCQPSVGVCDEPDVCDGVFGGCIERFVAAGTVCDATINGVCDAPDVCTGSTGNCPGVFLAGVECRAGTGACDAPELCTGGEAACPPDSLSAAGLVCRASIDTDCDPSEACSGVSSACPADLNSCVPEEDAGTGDGGDAGEGPPPATGCSCRATRSDRGLLPLLALLLLAIWGRARRHG
jgi:hypothetical protein